MSKQKATGGQKADFTVKLVLMFFISLLSFSVGTYLGKQVSDADYQRVAREAEYSGEQGQPVAPNANEEATETIKDEEVASLTEEFLQASRKVASEETAPTKGEPTTQKPAASGKTDHD